MLMLIAKSEAQAKLKEYFNTSHVNVNLLSLTLAITIYINFNTSHVNVNQFLFNFKKHSTHYFNTSHVNVNLSKSNAVQ